MEKAPPAASPDAYVEALDGWRRELAEFLRREVLGAAQLDQERIKWGHIVGFSNGPLLLLRVEDERVLLGFWRGKRLRDIEPRLKGDGKYELATVELREGDAISAATVRKLVRQAVKLNAELGDPTARA